MKPKGDPFENIGPAEEAFLRALLPVFKQHMPVSKDFQLAHCIEVIEKHGPKEFKVKMKGCAAAAAGDPCCWWEYDEVADAWFCVEECD